MFASFPLHQTDFYKTGHEPMFPDFTSVVFSNITPRGSRIDGIDWMYLFNLQGFIKRFLIDEWNRNFFSQPKKVVLAKYQRRLNNAGIIVDLEHIEALHDLQYLPIEIWALPEGRRVPLGVPPMVIWNTGGDQYSWLTNYLESPSSCELWKPCRNMTIAAEYIKILRRYAKLTGGSPEFVPWQGHDFSMRGMSGMMDAAMCGAAHLAAGFYGTDTISAIDYLEQFYNANSDMEIVGGSVPATEHSVMCMGQKESESATFRRLMALFPTGILSVVSDTWDYWHVLTNILPALKDEIMARDGKLVIRPDSGDPEKILCGDPDAPAGSPARKGTFQILWEIFGGTINEKGYKMLDPHIGVIYGDSITLKRCENICENLASQLFVPSMVFGIGSFTYQFGTRDDFGVAIKATYGEVDGEPREIFKDPITSNGTKKSAKGLLAVYDDENGKPYLVQQASWEQVKNCAFEQVFVNGTLTRDMSLAEIRENVARELEKAW